MSFGIGNHESSTIYLYFLRFHEMGTQDLPAIVDHISERNHQKGNIIYIGHSMGTTISYIYSSIMKEHAETNLKAIISFAPIAYLAHVKGLFAIVALFADIIKVIFIIIRLKFLEP